MVKRRFQVGSEARQRPGISAKSDVRRNRKHGADAWRCDSPAWLLADRRRDDVWILWSWNETEWSGIAEVR